MSNKRRLATPDRDIYEEYEPEFWMLRYPIKGASSTLGSQRMYTEIDREFKRTFHVDIKKHRTRATELGFSIQDEGEVKECKTMIEKVISKHGFEPNVRIYRVKKAEF